MAGRPERSITEIKICPYFPITTPTAHWECSQKPGVKCIHVLPFHLISLNFRQGLTIFLKSFLLQFIQERALSSNYFIKLNGINHRTSGLMESNGVNFPYMKLA